jgi:hypothetical protein
MKRTMRRSLGVIRCGRDLIEPGNLAKGDDMRIRGSRRHKAVLCGAALAAGLLSLGVLPAGASATPAAISGPGTLRGVYCTSAGNCWAVGNVVTSDVQANQVLHWNGKKWSKAAVPSQGGTQLGDFSELFAVRCTSPGSCWAVGEYSHGHALFNQVLRWNGKKWQTTAGIPQPGGKADGDTNELRDVACTSADSCWAVGDVSEGSAAGDVQLNQALHWNGKRWSLSKTPNPGGTMLNDESSIASIRCASVSDCWAVGQYGTQSGSDVLFNEVLHWTGKKWSTVSVPSPGGTSPLDISTLRSVSCTAPSSCKAAGSYGSNAAGGVRLNEVLRWNGMKWSLSPTPNPDGTTAGDSQNLGGVSCLTPKSCWAVGQYGSQAQPDGTLNEALFWNGKKWTQVTTPNPGGIGMHDVSQFDDIRCVTAADCWAVGNLVSGGGAFRDMILHWNGAKWSVR